MGVSNFFLHSPNIIMTSSFLLTVVVAPFLLFSFINKKKLPLLPGPKMLLVIGNLHQLAPSPNKSIQRLSKEYGPIMFLQLGSVPTLIVSSADMARDIFKTHDLIFSGRPDQMYVAKRITYNCNSLSFAPYGEYWREIRKIAILELLSSKKVQSFQAVRDEELTLMLDFITTSSGPINLNRLTILLTNSIVSRVIFGKKFDSGRDGSASTFDKVLHETQALLGGFCLSDYFPWMKWINKFNGLEASVERNFREFDQLYDEVIEEHLDSKRPKLEQEDLVDVLLRIQKDQSQAISLNNQQIKAVLTDMFIAGTDTSASTLVWTMAELMRNPSGMKRAQDEVREAVKGRKKVEESDLSKLMYLKLVKKESLRLHPPIPLLLPRETTEDCTIRWYKVPTKTRVLINARSIGTDPKYWKNPNEFRPERFLDSSVDFKGQHFELIPFGLGRRGCPGINFGMQLVELALANLLHRFDWKFPDEMRREDLDMEEAFGLTMFKKIPLCLVASHVNF